MIVIDKCCGNFICLHGTAVHATVEEMADTTGKRLYELKLSADCIDWETEDLCEKHSGKRFETIGSVNSYIAEVLCRDRAEACRFDIDEEDNLFCTTHKGVLDALLKAYNDFCGREYDSKPINSIPGDNRLNLCFTVTEDGDAVQIVADLAGHCYRKYVNGKLVGSEPNSLECMIEDLTWCDFDDFMGGW